MKKILFLGAAPHQCPAIRHALARGCEVHTCDFLPDNPGHRLAHRAHSLSVVDHAAVTALAARLGIDAVIGYASEPCGLAAAAVADALRLPGCGLPAALRLTDKAVFRRLLREEGIQDLPFAEFQPEEREAALRWMASLDPAGAVVKPADGSGSSGVTLRPEPGDRLAAFDAAVAASPSRRVIIETFVGRMGGQIGGEAYFEEGRLAFLSCGESFPIPGVSQADILCKMFPAGHPPASLERLRDLIERSGRAAGLSRGPVNFDALIRPDGSPFLIEMAPRSGGNYLPDLVGHQTGVSLVAAAVECALDDAWRLPPPPPPRPGCHCNYVIHATRSGTLRSIDLHPDLGPHLLGRHLHRRPGSPVRPFTRAGDALGVLLLAFDTREQMRLTLSRMDQWCRVHLDP